MGGISILNKGHNSGNIFQNSFKTGHEVIKLYSYSTQLSTKFILLINVNMPTTVGILTFISMINTTSERLKARSFFICRYFSFYEQLKFCAQLSWAWKKFYNLGVWGHHHFKFQGCSSCSYWVILLKKVCMTSGEKDRRRAKSNMHSQLFITARISTLLQPCFMLSFLVSNSSLWYLG